MKKFAVITAIVLAIAMLLCACGPKEGGVVGTWKAAEGTGSSDFGAAFRLTADGKVSFDIDVDAIGLDAEQKAAYTIAKAAMSLVKMTYKVVSDSEMEMTMSMLGLTQTEKVSYKLVDEDTLIFDGKTYTRVK